jgi:multiple sugar transport system permease protein
MRFRGRFIKLLRLKTKRTSPYYIKKQLIPYLYVLPAFILLGMLMLYPIAIVIEYSLFDNVISNPNPIFIGIKHYIEILQDPTLHISLFNTLYFTIVSVIFHLVIGLCFALLLNSRINGIFRSFLRIFYIIPWIFTATIVAIIWRLLLNPLGVVNYILKFLAIINENTEWFGNSNTALQAVTFVNIWAGYPFYMVSLLAGLQGIPQDMYEAAIIDGANEKQRLFAITIPHLIPIMMSIALLDFIWTMQVFPLVWMTTGGGPIHASEMVSTYTYKLAFTQYQYSTASAAAVIILILSMCLAFFYVRNQKIRG